MAKLPTITADRVEYLYKAGDIGMSGRDAIVTMYRLYNKFNNQLSFDEHVQTLNAMHTLYDKVEESIPQND